MEITRLVGLSLYYAIQDKLSQQRIKEQATSADFLTYILKYNSIVYSQPVQVYINGTLQSSSTYTVNYNQGIVKLGIKLTSSDVVEVSYYFCPVSLYDNSQNPNTNNAFKYPAVAIYEHNRHDVPYELGSSIRLKLPQWNIDIWSERGGERDDITDLIVEMIEEEELPIIDYNIAFPVSLDGTLNTSFNYEGQIKGYLTTDSINYLKAGSLSIGDTPKFLAEIYADFTIIV